jgi:UDP-N-acetylmuramate-alanine ligase
MYFSIKAFNGTNRRFENLDNIQELNEFVENFGHNGVFNKFVIKSFDQDGFRKKVFYVLKNGLLIKLSK